MSSAKATSCISASTSDLRFSSRRGRGRAHREGDHTFPTVRSSTSIVQRAISKITAAPALAMKTATSIELNRQEPIPTPSKVATSELARIFMPKSRRRRMMKQFCATKYNMRMDAAGSNKTKKIAAGVLHHGDRGSGYVRRRHGELGAAPFHPLVIGLHIVGEEHGRGLGLLEHRLLVGFGRRIVVERQLQLRALGVLW